MISMTDVRHLGRLWQDTHGLGERDQEHLTVAKKAEYPLMVAPLYSSAQPITVWSYGGGTQSIALAVLVQNGTLARPDRVVFADTSREATETFEYTERWVKPILAELGMQIEVAGHELATVDLYSPKSRDLLIPAFTTQNGLGQMSTFCSNEWKKRVIMRYLRSVGVQACKMWMGFSLDEFGRMKDSGVQWIEHTYPLIDLRLRRSDCRKLVLSAGLPEPPKSSCFMCPHRGDRQWKRLRDEYPDDWQKAIEFDEAIREKDEHVFLHRSGKPLRDVRLDGEEELPLTECSTGYCMV